MKKAPGGFAAGYQGPRGLLIICHFFFKKTLPEKNKDWEVSMKLIPANDFEAVKAAYLDVISHTPRLKEYARWIYGMHPSDEELRSHIAAGEMYVLTDGTEIAGMAAIVLRQGPDYRAVSWAEPLADDQVATLHLLAVCPLYQKRGLGGTILEEAAEVAKRMGKRALRLDTLRSNTPAQRMYEKAGFSYRGKQRLYAENTGWADFLYYEKTLD